MTRYEIIKTDILVIGAGLAGCRAAVEASNYDVQVTLVSKGPLGKSGCSPTAIGGYAAAFGHEDDDNPEAHFTDTIKAGCFLNSQLLVEILTREALDQLLYLEKLGVQFNKKNRKFIQESSDGHSFKRRLTAHERTGPRILAALKREILRREILLLEDTVVSKLLTYGSQVVGAIILNIKDGTLAIVNAKCSIIATGGLGNMYPITTNPPDVTGDGMPLAYNARAELIDMEFIQFYPTLFVYPEALRGQIEALHSFLYPLGAKLINSRGERFIERYDPIRKELTTRDILAKAVYIEIKEGRCGKSGGVYLDLSTVPFGSVMESMNEKEVYLFEPLLDMNLGEEFAEVAPGAHFACGGIRINDRCETSLKGLYAAGEVAGGIHGANRLEANALPETQVFGARAGKYAAERALLTNTLNIDCRQIENEYKWIRNIKRPKKEGIRPVAIKKKIQELMWKHAGILRNENGLTQGLHELEEIKKLAISRLDLSDDTTEYNYELVEALEVFNMLDLAKTVLLAALRRKETRGTHNREDYPYRDDKNWLKNIVVERGIEPAANTIPISLTRIKL